MKRLSRKRVRKKREDYEKLAFPKGDTRRARKDAKQKHEQAVKARVRQQVFRRDTECRVPEDERWPHDGPDEWAHLEEGRRARTRGQDPEERHTARLSCRLCRAHHQAYDAHIMLLRFTSDRGADGDIEWTVDGEVVGGGLT